MLLLKSNNNETPLLYNDLQIYIFLRINTKIISTYDIGLVYSCEEKWEIGTNDKYQI